MKFTCLITMLFVFCSVDFAHGQTPRTPEAFMDRGIERQAKGDLDGAIEDFTMTISLKPQALVLAAAYNNRANALTSKNDLAGAIAITAKQSRSFPEIRKTITTAAYSSLTRPTMTKLSPISLKRLNLRRG
jgi:tetratricopeptide (TPR) repeat protein